MPPPSAPSLDAPPRRPSGGQWRDGWRLVLWFFVCLVGPWLVLHKGPPPQAPERAEGPRVGAETIDVKEVIAQLRAAQPDCIGIGNSMMFTRLGMTPEALSKLTGKKFFFIYKPGSDAAVWYLLLKNIVAASGVHPKVVMFFVRDNELTAPYTGRMAVSAAYLKALRSGNEPELERFIQAGRSGKAAGRVDQWLDKLYATEDWREQMSRRMTDMAMDLGGGSAAKKAQRFMLSARFGLEHLRGDVHSDMPQAEASNLMSSGYAEGTQASLLPDMLHAAQGCGAKLLIVRVKRRPDAVTNLPEEPAAMREYARFLDGWMKQQGGLFFDETYDLSIHLSDYLDGDHIRPERLDWYRGYFWERMHGVIP